MVQELKICNDDNFLIVYRIPKVMNEPFILLLAVSLNFLNILSFILHVVVEIGRFLTSNYDIITFFFVSWASSRQKGEMSHTHTYCIRAFLHNHQCSHCILVQQ